jgi:hypothetical protein
MREQYRFFIAGQIVGIAVKKLFLIFPVTYDCLCMHYKPTQHGNKYQWK